MVNFTGWYAIPCMSSQNWTDKKFQNFALNTLQYRVTGSCARADGSDAYLLNIKDSDEKAFENYASACGIVYHRPTPQEIKRSQALIPFKNNSAAVRWCMTLVDLMSKGYNHTKTYYDNGKIKEIIMHNDNTRCLQPAIIGKFDKNGSMIKVTCYERIGENDIAITDVSEIDPKTGEVTRSWSKNSGWINHN